MLWMEDNFMCQFGFKSNVFGWGKQCNTKIYPKNYRCIDRPLPIDGSFGFALAVSTYSA